MDDKFFLVWNPNGMGPPRFRHPTFDSAKKEAIRLGTENPGQTFHVMENIGAAKTPAAVFTSVFPAQLTVTEVNLGEVTAGAATGRAVMFESTPNPSADDTWTPFRRYRGHAHIIADADYIPGIKDQNPDIDADTLVERASAEIVRLRTWLHRIMEAMSGDGWVSPAKRAIVRKACFDALTCDPPPFPYQAKASLPGFDDAVEVPPAPAVEERPARVLKHGEYEPGDRVRYTGRGPGRFAGTSVGRIGFFHEMGDSGFCLVDWAGVHDESPDGPTHTCNIEHVTLPQFEVGDEVRTRSGDLGIIESLGATTASIMGSDGHGFTTHYSLLTLVCPVQRRGAK